MDWMLGGRKRSAAVLVAAALLVGAPGVAEAQQPAGGGGGGGRPGAPGVGDTYYPGYGNGGYDVSRYDLDVTYDPATDRLDGVATIRATATQRLSRFNLDLVGLDVSSVSVDGRRASYSRSGQELTVIPRRPLEHRRRFDVVVTYGGVPVDFTLPGTTARTGFMTSDDGATVAGQPEVATAWFPVNDHPIDKAAYTFDVTVPDAYEVVANGFLRSRERARRGWSTWRWDAPEPMASYLATIDIGHWDVDQWRTESGLPVYDAVDTALTGAVRAEIDDSLSRQGEVLDLLESSFGPYPFDTVGGIVESQDDFVFALETQTRPVYARTFWEDNAGNPVDADWVVVHELAHQWFGDDVALARWQDIWLNEGFASYAEWLWEEHEGRDTPQEIFEATHAAIPADDPFWSVTIGDPGVDLLFDGAVYTRGAMTLQALRNEVGDDDFWAIVQRWASSRSGGHGTTPQFIALAERISGQQLDELFDTWLFTAGRPEISAASVDAAAAPAPAAASAPSGSAAASAAPNWAAVVAERLARGAY